MTLQIRSISLYHNDGRIRTIDFRLGQVNIITGDSAKGKSTLIDIIEYCFGRSSFNIKLNPNLRNIIKWYAVLYQTDDRQILVAKQRPLKGGKSRSTLFLKTGSNITLPTLDELVDNSDDDALVKLITNLIGIPLNDITPGEGRTLKNYTATSRHTIYYLYQPDYLISSPNELFYRQTDSPEMARTIRDTFPVLAGAVNSDFVTLQNELRLKQKIRRSKQRELEDGEGLSVNGIDFGVSIAREAAQVGLIDIDENTLDSETARALLQNIVATENDEITETYIGDEITKLQGNLDTLRQQHRDINEQISVYEAYERDAIQYADAAKTHRSRLATIHLFDSNGHNPETCPLCGSEMEQSVPEAQNIRESLQNMELDLEVVEYKRPALEKIIDQLRQDRLNVVQRIRQAEQDLALVIEEQEAARRIKDRNARVERALGRVELYQQIAPKRTDELAVLRREISDLDLEIGQLQNALDEANADERLESILFDINRLVTDIARSLPSEYRDGTFRFNLSKLTVVINALGELIRLDSTLGSTRNRLYAHLAAILAIRVDFVRRSRPIPGFLVLDQPSIAFFPDDTTMPDNIDEALADTDREDLWQVFALLFETVKEAQNNLQIIVLEHANYPQEIYQDSIVEVWRGDQGLVPADWLEK